MVIRQSLTAEAFLTAPRRSAAVPAPSGRLAFFTQTTPSLAGSTADSTQLMLLSLETRQQWPLATATGADEDDATEGIRDIHDICWVPARTTDTADELAWLRPSQEMPGATEIVIAEAYPAHFDPPLPYVAAVVPAPIRALRLGLGEDGSVRLAVRGPAGADGELFNEVTSSSGMYALLPPGSSARIHDSWHLDGTDRPRQVLWHGALLRKGKGREQPGSRNSIESVWGRWSLAGPLKNALQRTSPGLEGLAATDDFAVGPHGLVFVGCCDDARADPSTLGCSSVYFVPLDDFAEPAAFAPARIALVPLPLSRPAETLLAARPLPPPPPGFASHVCFSPDGSAVAFLWAPLDCPADRRLHLGHLPSGAAVDVPRVIMGLDHWPVVPCDFCFAPNGQAVILLAHDCGRRSLFWLDLQPGSRPVLLTKQALDPDGDSTTRRPLGSVSAFHILQPGDGIVAETVALLVSASSFVESSFYYLLDIVVGGDDDGSAAMAFDPRMLASTRDANRYGLVHETQVADTYFEGSGDGYCVQAWVVRPSNSLASGPQEQTATKYPVAILVHDGPEGAWEDEWLQTGWNAALWAEQGFVVVLPNITGSEGFGLDHSSRIYGSWGGFPFQDLDKCMDSLKEIPYIDMDRAILAGSGYGGYMTNWINGSNILGYKFRATVSENPIFSTEVHGIMASAVPGGIADFQGSVMDWENHVHLQRWNPAQASRLANWRTCAPPTLVVQADDADSSQADCLATFRALQFHGVSSRLVRFSGSAHRDAADALAWHRVVFAWLQQWTTRREE